MMTAEEAKVNAQGELPGCGPEWACEKFGQDVHDYLNCPKCKEWFNVYLAAKASIRAAA
jgi:hypothetical protein